jgi:lipopolysaccharide transport system ATP-binding protein
MKRPFAFVTQKAKRAVGMATKEEFWALKGVDLEIQKGEVIGIIGANGAGKSTLLKILTGITPPTEGEIIMRGRVASLLEVGTGFHPELTGRENIFLNGAILGMTGKEIARKFDEIVAFAGIEKFLDTPVKYYSSGMYVRLAFSVAAHMEPDILLVDEVLAVGDAEFQKKCLGKMEEVTRTGGRTILFVSHNMSAVKKLCKNSVLLAKGRVAMVGDTDTVIDTYLKTENASAEVTSDLFESAKMRLTAVRILDEHGKVSNRIELGKPFKIESHLEVSEVVSRAHLSITCTDIELNNLFFTADGASDDGISKITKPGHYVVTFTFPNTDSIALNEGSYYLYVQPETNGVDGFGERLRLQISIIKPQDREIPWDWSKERRNGPLAIVGSWDTTRLK